MFGLGDQGGCERRIEDFVKIQKNGGSGGVGRGSGWGGGQGGCERRIEVFGKIRKKKIGGGGRGEGCQEWGIRWGVGLVGVVVDVNAMLGVGGGVGYGNQE